MSKLYIIVSSIGVVYYWCIRNVRQDDPRPAARAGPTLLYLRIVSTLCMLSVLDTYYLSVTSRSNKLPSY